MTSQWVMVDEADSSVQYGAGWTAHSNVQDNPGDWGPPFDGTEHTADTNTTVPLTFTGTSIIVLGKLDGNNATGRPDPYRDCILDGEDIPRCGYSTSFTGHWIFCNRQNIPDGQHTFTLTTSTTGARTISVDQFRYLASPTISIDNAKVQIDTDSERVQFLTSLPHSTGDDRPHPPNSLCARRTRLIDRVQALFAGCSGEPAQLARVTAGAGAGIFAGTAVEPFAIEGGADAAGVYPYSPTQTSPLTSPAATSTVPTTSNAASSSSRPDSGELPPPQYSDIAPLRGPPTVVPTTKGTVLAP
ncbi:unnamed protein product [Cyclocybe aegerita]|uniref:Uncharacterized protein n=1 Tax=Cyclocybe aegerita TaxID=1973307 RepID=A0A8S0XQB3_CYCAE|nr:unnamed protein product [Cyclocybe aegerita]